MRVGGGYSKGTNKNSDRISSTLPNPSHWRSTTGVCLTKGHRRKPNLTRLCREKVCCTFFVVVVSFASFLFAAFLLPLTFPKALTPRVRLISSTPCANSAASSPVHSSSVTSSDQALVSVRSGIPSCEDSAEMSIAPISPFPQLETSLMQATYEGCVLPSSTEDDIAASSVVAAVGRITANAGA